MGAVNLISASKAVNLSKAVSKSAAFKFVLARVNKYIDHAARQGLTEATYLLRRNSVNNNLITDLKFALIDAGYQLEDQDTKDFYVLQIQWG